MSLVIPATDSPGTLPECRAAVEEAIRAMEPGVASVEMVIVTEPDHLSAAGARNLGVRRAKGDIVVFVDADVTIHSDALVRIRDSFAADPGLCAVFGSYDDEPADTSMVSAFRNLLHHHVHHDNAGSVDTFWTGLGAVRRSHFLDAGGFDEERYRYPSIEDIELGDRLARSGLRIDLDPTIQGTHLKRWTFTSMVRTDFALRAIPWIAMQVRNRRLSTSMNLSWRHRISAVAAVAVFAAAATLAWQPVRASAAMLIAVGVMVGMNRRLYRLLAARLGVIRGVGAVGLHVVHHLVAVAALPVGLITAFSARERVRPVDLATVSLDIEEAA